MSVSKISLRLSGNLPPSDELTKTLGFTPTKALRRGERISQKRVQPVDIWSLELAEIDTENTKEESDKKIQQVGIILQKMAPALAALDRTNCKADLYISTIREEQQGGLSLPSEVVNAATAANLSIKISILAMLDDYEEVEESKLSRTAY